MRARGFFDRNDFLNRLAAHRCQSTLPGTIGSSETNRHRDAGIVSGVRHPGAGAHHNKDNRGEVQPQRDDEVPAKVPAVRHAGRDGVGRFFLHSRESLFLSRFYGNLGNQPDIFYAALFERVHDADELLIGNASITPHKNLTISRALHLLLDTLL